MLSNEPRCLYQNNPLADVICQLRFPEILTIEANAPVDLQEAIRSVFPKYAVHKETYAPRLTGVPGNMQLVNQAPTNNYQFISADGVWRVNLTSKFISLSCSRYTKWEDFAKRLDLPLAAFIQVYSPALFERIGLRYINAISRRDLNLQDEAYRDLIHPMYLGPMSSEYAQESAFNRCSIDFEANLGSNIRAKVHAGPGIISRNGMQDSESKFIFDQDLYIGGDIAVNHAASTLDLIHAKAFRLFRGAITDTLHEALEPTII